jgi:hypothetical protein
MCANPDSAKAPTTKAVWLESRILLTYYHGHIRARILVEVPKKSQSPHTHTRRLLLLNISNAHIVRAYGTFWPLFCYYINHIDNVGQTATVTDVFKNPDHIFFLNNSASFCLILIFKI